MRSSSDTPIDLPPRLRDQALFRTSGPAAFGNPGFAEADARVLILRLSPWRDVASSSPHLFLARSVRRAIPGAFLDFAFLPLPEDRRRRHAARAPLALGVQSRRGLAAFDLVLVSNSFTLEMGNLPALLLDAGLSAWADERPAEAPAILLGGSNALAAHALVRPDGVGVPDAIFFGEAETCLVPFLRAWQAAAGAARRERLLRASADLDGFWVTGAWPDAGHPVRQAVAREVFDAGAASTCDPLLDGPAADTVRLQAAAGCPAFCSFCFEGFERKPYREVPADPLLAYARQRKRESGARCVDLDAFTLNCHADAARLIAGLSRLFERVSLKSQRVDLLAAQPSLAALELAVGKRSFTLGIEGISARLRAFLNKTVTDDEIDRALQRLLAQRVREIKLFYLITGHETAADLAAFGAFVRALGQRVSGACLTTRIVFSFGFLVRMPRTPLRYDRLFLDRALLERIAQELERMCRCSEFEFRLAASWSEYVATQMLAAGDHRLAPVVVALAREGFLYDGESAAKYARRLQEAWDAAGLGAEFAKEKSAKHRFPFEFVVAPVKPSFLWNQYQAARDAHETGYCLGDTCLACGACRDQTARQALTGRPRVPAIPADVVAEVDAGVRNKQRLPLLACRVRLGAAFDRASSEWTSARLLQLLLAQFPEEVDNLLAVEEALFASPDNRARFPIAAGETAIALKAWNARRLSTKIAGARTRPPHAAELEFLDLLPAFTPGRFVAATWRVSASAKVAGVEEALAGWLQEARLPFTLRRVAGGARFDLAPAACRKGIVLAAACRVAAGGTQVELTGTAKTDLHALLRRLPPAMDDAALVCTRIDWGKQP